MEDTDGTNLAAAMNARHRVRTVSLFRLLGHVVVYTG